MEKGWLPERVRGKRKRVGLKPKNRKWQRKAGEKKGGLRRVKGKVKNGEDRGCNGWCGGGKWRRKVKEKMRTGDCGVGRRRNENGIENGGGAAAAAAAPKCEKN